MNLIQERNPGKKNKIKKILHIDKVRLLLCHSKIQSSIHDLKLNHNICKVLNVAILAQKAKADICIKRVYSKYVL